MTTKPQNGSTPDIPDGFLAPGSDEGRRIVEKVRQLRALTAAVREPGDGADVCRAVRRAIAAGAYRRETHHGFNPLLHYLDTAVALCRRVSPDRSMVLAQLLYPLCREGQAAPEEVHARWGQDIGRLVDGLLKVSTLYARGASVQTENFRNLLLTFASDIRVIIMMIVERLVLMQAINHHPDQGFVLKVAEEASYLYAPLAHRLGLYAIKGELEDMSLKYSNREIYTQIARKLNETKVARDAYIAAFIQPVRQKLLDAGLVFDIKGRTKSIYSIWNKMKKQRVDLDHIYDLFAIRIIIDTAPEREKSDCWLAYSLITDMYVPNPSRMKDWLSIPKSNGYESLHITVAGPQDRWVEVQIRTRRMDLVAEKGLAAHWKYKGGHAEAGLDAWMNNVRDILEAGAEAGPTQLMKNMRMDVYDKEVFVFTPKGDLHRLPKGATLLDFAFSIHSGLGCRCTGGRVNGHVEKLGYRLSSGDTVEILTGPSQAPRRDWLNMVVTSKARAKIRATINEQEHRLSAMGREMLERRLKNRKMTAEVTEADLARLFKKMGHRTVSDFYHAIATEKVDINAVLDNLEALREADRAAAAAEAASPVQSAQDFTLLPQGDQTASGGDAGTKADVLVIGTGEIKGVNYRMARCCNPIYGDPVFGFVSSEGVIKIHRADCPNAASMRSRHPHRIIQTRWSGRAGDAGGFAATLRVLGRDDIGIVTNISSLINKQPRVNLRSIAINASEGLFDGILVVDVTDTTSLTELIKKIKTIKGVKDVQRSK